VMGGWLDWVILWVFSNLGDSVILLPCCRTSGTCFLIIQRRKKSRNSLPEFLSDSHFSHSCVCQNAISLGVMFNLTLWCLRRSYLNSMRSLGGKNN